MAKFNSLGSNWTLRQALLALTIKEGTGKRRFLPAAQEEYYYKGREALRAALRKLDLAPKSRVAMTGFTCLAVYAAIVAEKLVPVIIDIDETLNLDVEKLKTKSAQGKIEVVILQNTFGFTQRRVEELLKWARQNQVKVIEDNAHAFGARYDNGRRTGEVGEMAIFSASQDKILDSVSGGVLVMNKKKYVSAGEKIALVPTPSKQQKKDRWYPLLTWLIRRTYGVGLGKVLHAWARRGKKLSQPMHYLDEGGWQELPAWQKVLLQERQKVALAEQAHRQKRVTWYLENLMDENLFWRPTKEEIGRAAALRWPVKVAAEKREEVLRKLEKAGYHLRDFWYDAPVGPEKYVRAAGYKISGRQLPVATKVAQTIINLPTHREISKSDVKKMCRIISQA